MEFGKLHDIAGVDFRLPPDPVATTQYLVRLPPPAALPAVYLGCTGWGMPEWVGEWYPAGARSKDFLRHYGQQFNTIELNTTHYRIPTATTVKSWCEQTPEDFRFCPKLPQTISHDRSLGLGGGAIDAFVEAISALGERLGSCFMQLPPHFGPDRLPLLRSFLLRWPCGELPLALELRHADWFIDPREQAALADLLQHHQVGLVMTDVAGRRDVLHGLVTAPRVLVRFVGNALHPTDYSRIDDWVARIGVWTQAGLPEVYFFTHEPDNTLAPDLAYYLWQKLLESGHYTVRGPQRWRQALPPQGQMSLFD